MKRNLVDKTSDLSLNTQLSLLQLAKGSFYYVPKGESEENLAIMRLMDTYILEDPTAGVLHHARYAFRKKGYKAGYERIRRLMRLAGIMPIYPRRHLTVLGDKKYIHPYLLRDLAITHSNQVWAIDITYVPMQQGFMYLTAIMDVYSRRIVAWGLSNTLEANASLQVVENAINQFGKPEILNSDQGSQFTCSQYVELLKTNGIRISMDSKGRAIDNIYIERFWRSIKYRHIYLNPANDGIALYKGIHNWIEKYNMRKHQGTGEKPKVRYQNAA
jgi:putative transposase